MARTFLTLSLLTAGAAAAQSVFTWTEADGTVVYTDDPTHAPSSSRTTTGGELNVVPSRKPFPLPEIDGARWASDRPECSAALERVTRQQARITVEEQALNDLMRAFAPCQRFLDVCYDRRLTLGQWKAECQLRPTACDVPIDAQRWKVTELRAQQDELLTWLRKMGDWGCAR
jgi:hypothetical protein